MRVDHVIYGVRDLDEGIKWFRQEYGLEAVHGGSHPHGSSMAIISLGPGQYLELLAPTDPSSDGPMTRYLNKLTANGDRFSGVCLLPTDLDAVATRLSLQIREASRIPPGGDEIRWRIAGVEAAYGPLHRRLPYFIDWQDSFGPAIETILRPQLDIQPAESRLMGIAWVEMGGDRERLREWIGSDTEEIRAVGGEPGPHAVAVRRSDDTLLIIR